MIIHEIFPFFFIPEGIIKHKYCHNKTIQYKLVNKLVRTTVSVVNQTNQKVDRSRPIRI